MNKLGKIFGCLTVFCLVSGVYAKSDDRKNVLPSDLRVQTAAKGRKLPGNLRQIEKELEDIDRKLNRQKYTDSDRNASLMRERQKLSLRAIHESQRYILENKDKRSVDLAGVKAFLSNECDFMEKSIRDAKAMPYLKQMKDFEKLISGIRGGKVNFPGRRSMTGSKIQILQEIQKLQKDALDEIQRNEHRNRRKNNDTLRVKKTSEK